MEILRVPPYPIDTTWTLPLPNYTYNMYLEDLVDHSLEIVEVESDSNGVVVYELTLEKLQLDRNFLVKFYDTAEENVLYEDTLDIVRPYVNPNNLGITASEIADKTMYEMIARSIIDTYVDGFYHRKSAILVQGNGADYVPVWKDVNRVLKVYENNVVVFDINTPNENLYNYTLTLDNSAIIKETTELTNNIVSANPIVPISTGDLAYDARSFGNFPKGRNYVFVVDEGYRSVPADVEKATLMLIADLECGKLDYYSRYINSYNTDQFKIQFDKSMMSGTGNMLVDKILDKYLKSIKRLGVL